MLLMADEKNSKAEGTSDGGRRESAREQVVVESEPFSKDRERYAWKN